MVENQLRGSNRMPKGTIAMPFEMRVYNEKKFIRKDMVSLLAQTLTDFELIISDNASTDGTEEICRHYVTQDSRILYCRQTQKGFMEF